MRQWLRLLRPEGHREGVAGEAPPEERCIACGAELASQEIYRRYRVCPQCRFHYSLPARQRVALLADPGSFREHYHAVTSLDPLSFSAPGPYRQRLFEAQRRTGLPEAALVGTCTIEGRGAVLVVLDYGFLGGSMGCVVGEKVALAFELAAKEKLPLIAVLGSSGSRVQEGVLALMQQAKSAGAAHRLHRARLPYICVMANPTTGGVYTSFASLADLILAEPGAALGYAPRRVVEATAGGALPPEAHTAEAHLAHGIIDQIVERPQLREVLASLLDLLGTGYRLSPVSQAAPYEGEVQGEKEAWAAVQRARHPQRPTARDYIARLTTSFVELRGDRSSGDDPAVVCGPALLGGQAVMVVGTQRLYQDGERWDWVRPEGFRKARRAMLLAGKLRLPVITLIDTPGAYPGLEAEERGLGGAIARCLATLTDLPTPIVAVLIGEGGSEGALAFAVADRVLMQENAILSVISPEGAAAIFYRDEARAGELAQELRLTARDCKELGVVDLVVPEPEGGAHTEPMEAARLLQKALLFALTQAQAIPQKRLLAQRQRRYRRSGQYTSYVGAALLRQVNRLQGLLKERTQELRERLRPRAL